MKESLYQSFAVNLQEVERLPMCWITIKLFPHLLGLRASLSVQILSYMTQLRMGVVQKTIESIVAQIALVSLSPCFCDILDFANCRSK